MGWDWRDKSGLADKEMSVVSVDHRKVHETKVRRDEIGLIKLTKPYGEIFSKQLGKCPKFKVDVQLNGGVSAKFFKHFSNPFCLKEVSRS